MRCKNANSNVPSIIDDWHRTLWQKSGLEQLGLRIHSPPRPRRPQWTQSLGHSHCGPRNQTSRHTHTVPDSRSGQWLGHSQWTQQLSRCPGGSQRSRLATVAVASGPRNQTSQHRFHTHGGRWLQWTQSLGDSGRSNCLAAHLLVRDPCLLESLTIITVPTT